MKETFFQGKVLQGLFVTGGEDMKQWKGIAVIVLMGTALLASEGCRMERKTSGMAGMDKGAGGEVLLPLIDRNVPSIVETATFALG
ncbi:MAG: hypothetical protein JW884_04740 [Deltaproteobacteria bacterium]|nr:hypothetical protein [Deltaproteobacteria bacterium]